MTTIAIIAAKMPKNNPQFLFGKASSMRYLPNHGGMTLIVTMIRLARRISAALLQ